MTSSFRLETKSKETTQPQIVQSIEAGIKWLGQERQCGLGLNKETPSCEGKKRPKERLSYQNEFWEVLHDHFNKSPFQLSVFFSVYSSKARTPASHAREFLMSQPSASDSELQKSLAWQGLTISGRLWKRGLLGGRTAAVDKRPLAGLETRTCGKPRNNRVRMGMAAKVSVPSPGLSLWGLRKERGVPLSFPPKPHSSVNFIS